MSDYPMVVGVDPGFANFGVAVVRLLPEREAEVCEEIVFVDVFRTKPSSKRRHLLAVDDDGRRLSLLGRQFDELCKDYGVMAVIAEEKRRLPHSESATKLAMGWAVALLIAILRRIPFMQVTPGEIKLAVASSERASKAEVQRAIKRLYVESKQLDMFDARTVNKATGKPCGHRAHGYDALGAVIAALDSEIIRAIRPR